MNYLYLIILGIVCYFIGNISGSIAISKLVYKQDIRNYGSKNAGATNALRVYGVKVGLATFLIDFFKGLLCAYLGFKFYGSLGILVCGLLCVIGHILPVLYNFKGGKGIATSFVCSTFTSFNFINIVFNSCTYDQVCFIRKCIGMYFSCYIWINLHQKRLLHWFNLYFARNNFII